MERRRALRIVGFSATDEQVFLNLNHEKLLVNGTPEPKALQKMIGRVLTRTEDDLAQVGGRVVGEFESSDVLWLRENVAELI